MNNHIRVAKLIFALDAVLGILVVGGACLYGASYNRHAQLLPIFLDIFMPLALLWALLCYWAYQGLTSEKAVLKFVFWFYIVCNVISFPIGTGIAGVSIWLRRELRKPNIHPVSD